MQNESPSAIPTYPNSSERYKDSLLNKKGHTNLCCIVVKQYDMTHYPMPALLQCHYLPEGLTTALIMQQMKTGPIEQ